eukprot:2182639-Prymnesium_polylepis.1
MRLSRKGRRGRGRGREDRLGQAQASSSPSGCAGRGLRPRRAARRPMAVRPDGAGWAGRCRRGA